MDHRHLGVAVHSQTRCAIRIAMDQAVRAQVTRACQFSPTPKRFSDKTLPGD